jgi:PncC family amidohydrolase
MEIAGILKKKKKTLAFAESCTGGLASHRITNIPGSSVYFSGAVVAYSNDIKMSILGVPQKTIKTCGAVSRETARAMAEGARRTLNADITAAVTGIAGPGGGSAKKPVGLAYMAFTSEEIRKSQKVVFSGTRRELQEQFAQALLEFVLTNIHDKTLWKTR